MERKFLQWNSGALDFNFFWIAPKINQCAPQRFRANQDQLHCVEHLPCGLSIGGFVHVHRNISAVKRNDRRVFPCANQWQEVDSDLAKVNVQEASVGSTQEAQQGTQLCIRNLPWRVADLPEPKPPQEMCCRLGKNLDRLKWEALGLLAFLCDDHWSASFQGGDLPINMQHLRLQKRRAITGDSWA